LAEPVPLIALYPSVSLEQLCISVLVIGNGGSLDDADRVAEKAIQRRAHLGSPENGFHDSRDPARIGRNRGGGGGPDAGEEEG